MNQPAAAQPQAAPEFQWVQTPDGAHVCIDSGGTITSGAHVGRNIRSFGHEPSKLPKPEFHSRHTNTKSSSVHHVLDNPTFMDKKMVSGLFEIVRPDQHDHLHDRITKARPDLAEFSGPALAKHKLDAELDAGDKAAKEKAEQEKQAKAAASGKALKDQDSVPPKPKATESKPGDVSGWPAHKPRQPQVQEISAVVPGSLPNVTNYRASR